MLAAPAPAGAGARPLPARKRRDWPVIIGLFVGGLLAFKLCAYLISMSPVGKAQRAANMIRQDSGSQGLTGNNHPLFPVARRNGCTLRWRA